MCLQNRHIVVIFDFVLDTFRIFANNALCTLKFNLISLYSWEH